MHIHHTVVAVIFFLQCCPVFYRTEIIAQRQIARALGYPVSFYDGGDGAARETQRLLTLAGTRNTGTGYGQVVFTNSEETPERMALCRKLFCFPTLIGTETTIPAV